jgi:hypothetical protein
MRKRWKHHIIRIALMFMIGSWPGPAAPVVNEHDEQYWAVANERVNSALDVQPVQQHEE